MKPRTVFLSALAFILSAPAVIFGSAQPEGTAGEKVVTLQAWINDVRPESKKYIEEVMIPDFEKANPNIKVEMQFVGWANHSERYLTAWAGGEVPDVFEPAVEQASEMIDKEQVIALDDYIKQWGELDDFFPVGYEPYMKGGKKHTLPFRLDVRNVYYRKDHFKEAGLDPEKAPDTWDDLYEYAVKLNKRDGSKVIRLGFNVETGNFGGQQYVEFVWQNGSELLSADNKKANANSPEAVEALTFLTNLYNELRPTGTATLPESPIPYFATGQQSMAYGNSSLFRDVEMHAPDSIDDIGIALPLMKKQRVNNCFGGGFSISSKSRNPDQAWEFIKAFISPESQSEWNNAHGTFPSRKSLVKHEYFSHPVQQKGIESAKYGKIYMIIPAWWEMMSKLGDGLELSYNKKKSPQEALDDVNTEWNRILRK